MSAVSFSSWNGKIIDNRTGKAARVDAGVPTMLGDKSFTALMGWNGLVVSGAANIPSLALGYLREARKLSCGECSVCSIGIDRIAALLEGLIAGRGKKQDVAEIERVARGVMELSKCNFGRASAVTPVLDAVRYYKDDFLALATGKKGTTSPYKTAVTAPCIEACPARLDIPGYIELIRNNKFDESLDLIRKRCILPGVIGRACTHPCEEACIRNGIDQTLAIRLLKRAAADNDLASGGGALKKPTAERPEKVAIVGAGPAGLAAAYHLRRMGYQVTIFEAFPKGGGMAAVGIPDYRLPKNILEHETRLIRELGADIQYNRKITKLDMDELTAQGFKAVFLGVGAHEGTRMGCKGEDAGYEGFVDGAVFLRDLALGKPVEPKGKVVIVGGGNVAMDCARSCLRLGFKDVEILYRRTRKEMPARAEEIDEALEEGVKIRYLVAPVSVLADGNRVKGLECIRMKLGEPDSSGRRRPVPVKGSEFKVKADMVIPAIGQKPELGFAGDVLQVTGWGTIEVNPETLRTNLEGVFAGGDCVSGPATLIEALDAGNRVARSIDAYLQGRTFEPEMSFKGIDVKAQRALGHVDACPQEKVSLLEPKERVKSFAEVEAPYSDATAMKEANRCLRCYRLVVWE
ncbi:MAG: FAD-dependent oxidoreductase [Pseudomonadota bacterium]|jgi:formate dehydrogenase beta subunit|nr:FAD-dependent oxidoreductase [Syntrophaceae bacterium]MDI9554784.1 FAD-dependent oxidoreductase [Pseudomonadota bacterium]NLX30755.1 FAD-dependent oxidoreductase [Deltaproteobacteria bacterium]HNU84664.1 FAD-dependent oxidoreductase [Syntrophales bacterium]HNZ33726.1 FAD-dependent oxidoreductase [Syntrophales bacterium]